MATLKYGSITWTVDHAVKGTDYIHAYDANGACVVAFDGVTDFSGFTYSGTYLSPTACANDACNDVKHVNGALVRRDGSAASHTHSTSDISGTLPVNKGGTGAKTFTSGEALIGAGTGAVTTRTIRNTTTTTGAITADTALITSNTLRYAINRTSGVAAANTAYTTLMARGTSLNATETTPAVNGAIAWTYQ